MEPDDVGRKRHAAIYYSAKQKGMGATKKKPTLPTASTQRHKSHGKYPA